MVIPSTSVLSLANYYYYRMYGTGTKLRGGPKLVMGESWCFATETDMTGRGERA